VDHARTDGCCSAYSVTLGDGKANRRRFPGKGGVKHFISHIILRWLCSTDTTWLVYLQYSTHGPAEQISCPPWSGTCVYDVSLMSLVTHHTHMLQMHQVSPDDLAFFTLSQASLQSIRPQVGVYVTWLNRDSIVCPFQPLSKSSDDLRTNWGSITCSANLTVNRLQYKPNSRSYFSWDGSYPMEFGEVFHSRRRH
jgi:hypothetical protein